MNFLAHAFLADPRPESILGNLIADFLKGRAAEVLPEGIRDGIRLHRRVDAFADRHPVFRHSSHRLRPRWGRYSGILIDMFYDHFLAADWERYADQSLRGFADHVYGVLRNHADHLPERIQTAARRMIHCDWLVSYADLEKLETSLNRLSRRSRNPNLRLDRAMHDLDARYESLRRDFRAFFPDLIAFAESAKREPVDV